ncbi:MAG: M48 family metallopeptidase [Treponema sp.]|jgi:predicted metal-dependent hydrolase|nr:M48 family metallopeptidase [Treponema sp.]
MAELLLVGNFRVEIEYKRVKTLRLTLYPPEPGAPAALPGLGHIRVSAPPHTPRQLIQNFVISKTAWIEKHRARFHGNLRATRPCDNETCYVWGLPHRLELTERQGRPRIVLAEGRILMSVRPGSTYEQRQKFLDRWYRDRCKEAAIRVTKFWEPRIGVTVQMIYYRKMKSHWGSCNYVKKTIRLNTELAKKAPECLEYVVLHEMLHMLEPSHNRNFYRLMDHYLPSWKAIRKKMNNGEL